MNSLIATGRFNHNREASVRLEGQTAWGVCHWRASRGGNRLRCGVLFHPVNRGLTFHGVASDVTELLLPMFEDRTFLSMELLPSGRPAQHRPLGDPLVPEDVFNRFLGPSSHPRPHATSASTRPAPPPPPPTPPYDEEHSLRSVISGLVAVCEANQVSIRHLTTEVHALRQRLFRNAACPRALFPAHSPSITADCPHEWAIATTLDVQPHWLRFTSSCLLCRRTLCCSLHQPRCEHPSTRPRRRRRVRRATPATVPVPQCGDSPVFPPSLSSARVPPPCPTPSVRDRLVGRHPLADHPLRLFADVVAVRSQCTLSAPRDTGIHIATATIAVSIISRQETAWERLFR